MRGAAVAALAVALGLMGWGLYGLTHHVIVTVDTVADAARGLSATEAALSQRHGTIAMVDEDIGATKSLIVHADLIARHEEQNLDSLDAVTRNANGAISDFRSTVRAAQAPLDSSAQLLNTANEAVAQLNDPDTGLAPMLTAYRNTGDDLDALLKRKAIGEVLDNAAALTENANGVAGDFRKVADKASADYLAPVPWYKKSAREFLDVLQIGATLAR